MGKRWELISTRNTMCYLAAICYSRITDMKILKIVSNFHYEFVGYGFVRYGLYSKAIIWRALLFTIFALDTLLHRGM